MATARGSDLRAGLDAHFLRTNALTDDDRRAWERLAGGAVEPNPFYGPRFVLAAAECRDEPAELLVVREGERWLACLPLTRARAWRRLRLPCLVPWNPEYTYIATPLIDAERLEPAAAALARRILDDRAAMVVLDPLHRGGPVATALHDALEAEGGRPIVYLEFERAALRRRPEPTYLDGRLSSRRRKDLRRARRGLEREMGGEVTVADRSTDEACWDKFLDMELRSWKGDAGTAVASDPGDAAFFRRLAAELSPDGSFQLLSLEVNGRAAAMQTNLLDGGELFGFKIAFERELAAYAPGVMLEVDAIAFIHHRVEADYVDSCAAPDNLVLMRLWPDRRPLETLLVPTRSPLAPLVRMAVGLKRLAGRVTRRRRTESGAR